jgi:hypothetical protein
MVMKFSTFTLSVLAFWVAASAQVSTAATADATAGKATLAASKARKNGFTPLPSKKGGSGVAMAYRIEGTPAVGNPLTIRLSMASSADAQVTLRAGEGLTLSNPDQVLSALAGQGAEHSVIVVPQAQGRYYLNVFSVAGGRGSAMSIPVQVGKGTVQLKSADNVQVLPSGERIISVPAQ